MRRLSLPIEGIKPHYNIVVIGSGYGGAIAASRLARAGQEVCLLERGKEFQPGEYPDTEFEILGEAQTDTPEFHAGSRTGLYDFRVNKDINVFLGCGLGGTSLVNANVSLPPERRVFEDSKWPEPLRNDLETLLADGFRRAGEMLKPTPYPDDFPALPKLEALKKSAAALGARFYRPPINVSFEDGVNHAGVEQRRCVLCGDCVTGCNHAAKNTVLMNYLPDARNHGAEIYTRVAVRQIERRDARWLVHYQIMDSGREAFDAPTMFVAANIVVVSAGTLGSSEILLRSKAAGLPLSENLGRRFTGNGDLLGFSYNGDDTINGVGFGDRPPAGREPVGPCIAGIIDMRERATLDEGCVVEEGSIPGPIASFLPLPLSTLAAVQGGMAHMPLSEIIAKKRRELESLTRGPHEGATKNTQTYLVMAHDGGDGRMILKDDRLRIEWPGIGERPLFKEINATLEKVSQPLHGIYVQIPAIPEFSKQGLTTVHPLGGCVMAEDAETGVVNHKGQLFSGSQGNAVHDGLYVCDGSVIPRPLGVNPLLTISALAERACALIAADRGWQIDYALTPPGPQPEDAAAIGVRFTETMNGYFSTTVKDDFRNAASQGEKDGSTFQFILTITAADLDHMISDPAHQARMIGSAIAPALSSKPLTVTAGQFNHFAVDSSRPETLNTIYAMRLESQEGRTYFFHGSKVLHKDSGLDLWDDAATLFITVFDGGSSAAPILGKGILKLKPEDVLKQLTTIEVTNAPSQDARLQALARFGKFLAGALYEIYGGVAAKANYFGPHVVARKKRLLRLGAPAVFPVRTADGVEVRLVRYQGGSKGPVMMVPGFGTSSLAFTLDTVETNFPEFLYAHGFDVWLFDYRGSPELASPGAPFTLDDIAAKDYPAAVSRVNEVSGARGIQVVAHGVGSMTLLMSAISGLQGVRSAICSSLALHPISPAKNSSPATKPCGNPACNLIFTMYGEVFDHGQLNTATHDAIHELFGVANPSALAQLALMIRKGKAVDKAGKDSYLPHLDRLKIPLTFVHGAGDRRFLIESTKKSFVDLSRKNGAAGYVHVTIPDYGHMDLFIGKNAAKNVFPELLPHLERFQ